MAVQTTQQTTGNTAFATSARNQDDPQKSFDEFVNASATTPQAPVVNTVPQTVGQGEIIPASSGQIWGDPKVKAETAKTAYAQAPEKVKAELTTTFKGTAGVNDALQDFNAVIGQLSPEAQVIAAQMDSTELAQLGLSAAQIAQAQQVLAPAKRKLEEGELIEGSSVDQTKVDAVANATANAAQTADPSKNATVQGQMEELMKDFEGGATPAWAAGAIRAANASMAARGLSSSSIAGQAILQSAMESALPIAAADAATWSTFEQQNLSNRQQSALLAAQQRASFLELDFNQNFQARVTNAAKITEIANQNYSADVQIALENAQLAQSVDLANLSAKNAKVLADAAAMTQLDLTNLDNRQKSAVQNAQSFLQMDMANLDNAQQAEVIKAQARVQSLLSDAAAENATRQFNATSKNQSTQFFAELGAQVSQFNATQANTMSQFNAGETNAMSKFKAEMQNQRDQFNANNRLVVDQANATWRQQVSTQNNSNSNEANRQAAQLNSDLTISQMNNTLQARRDVMSYVFTSSENSKTRATDILIAQMQADTASRTAGNASKAASKSALWQVAGSVVGKVISRIDW